MYCVFEFIHVLVVSSNVEDRSDWLRQLHLHSFRFEEYLGQLRILIPETG